MKSFNAGLQVKNIESAIKNKLKDFLSKLRRGFKFVATLLLEVKKIGRSNGTKHSTFYSNSKAETIINESNIDDEFESIYSTIISNIQKSLGKGLCWLIDSLINHTTNVLKCNSLAGSNYIKLPKKIRSSKKKVRLTFKF